MIEDFELLAEGKLAGDLTAEQDRSFTAHLAGCPDCRSRFEAHRQAASQLSLLVSAPLAPMSPGFTDKVMRTLPPSAPPAPWWPVVATTAALIAASAAWYVSRAPRPAGPPAPPSTASAAAPAPASAPTPLPSVARPRSAVGGLDGDAGGGAADR